MILKSESKNNINNTIAADLSLIISEFSTTVSNYECEAVIPISMWVELDDKKNELIRILNILNEQDVDLSVYDPNYDINSSVWNYNNTNPVSDINGYSSSNSSTKNKDCSPCSPIKIDFSSKLSKPEIKTSLKTVIDSSSFLFSSNSELICSSAMVLSNGCIPDLLKIVATLLMSLNVIFSGINLESMSLSSFLSGTIGASLDITIKKAMFMANVSVSKSDCLSKFIKEIIDSLPTPENIRANVDKLTIDRFKLNNLKTSGIEEMFNTIESKISSSGLAGADYVSKNLNKILSTIDVSILRVNTWIDGLFQLSNYIPCEKERSGNNPSGLVEEISNILTLINTIVAIIDKKYKKKICNQDEANTNSESVSEQNTTLTNEEITDLISSLVTVDTVVKNNDGITIAIILPSVELKTVYLDTFGCNLPTFMEKTAKTYSDDIVYDNSYTNIISPIGENIGEVNSLILNKTTNSQILNNSDSNINMNNSRVEYYIGNYNNNYNNSDIISISDISVLIKDAIKISGYKENPSNETSSSIIAENSSTKTELQTDTGNNVELKSINDSDVATIFDTITKTLNINVKSSIMETMCDK